jgi:RNA polymerase sigma-70 factor (ECF subfamily)
VPKVVVRPPGDPERERQARMRKLFEEHGIFLLGILSRPGVTPASAEDLRQEVIEVLSNYIDERGVAPPNVRGYLTETAKKKLANHRRLHGLDLDAEAEVEEAMTSSLDPEQRAEAREQWRRFARYVDKLSSLEQSAYTLVDLEGDTYEEAAEKLGRPVGTVKTQVARARTKLEAFAQASERAAEARLTALDERPEE